MKATDQSFQPAHEGYRQPGVADAQFSLGVIYYEGQGVAKDEKEAMKWYRKAAGQRGDRSAAALAQTQPQNRKRGFIQRFPSCP